MKRLLVCSIVLLALISSARGQKIYSYRYWFDDNLSTQHVGTTQGETTIEIDIGSLAKGSVHALRLQGLDARDKWGTVRTTYFFIAKEIDTQSATAHYWFDEDETTAHTVDTASGLIDLDTSGLETGNHAVYYQTFNARGEASPVWTAYFFFKKCDTNSVTARYWFDGDETTAQTVPTVSGTIALDISGTDAGTHTIHYQTFNASGDASPVKTAYFFKKYELQRDKLSCQIWIDDEEDKAQTFSLADDIVIEAEDLAVGMHELHVKLFDAEGVWLMDGMTTFEVKQPMVSITLTAALETFSCQKDLDFSGVEGLRAYTAAGFHRLTGNVWMMRVGDAASGEGLLLTGEPGTYEVPVIKSYSFYGNLLVGTSESLVLATTADGYDNYLLSVQNGEDGFFLAEDGSMLEAGRAYLRIPSKDAAEVRMLRISFDDNPDGITESSEYSDYPDTIYNLAGQRLSKPQKGINIRNGKKVLVK